MTTIIYQKMTTIIYHKNCSDGFCAAWLLHKQFPKATFIPCQYGDSVPKLEENCNLFIVDFSFDRDTLIDLSKKHNVVVLDHHKTIEENCKGLDFCTFDMNKCGARLTFEYIERKYEKTFWQGEQKLVDYIEDRDLWKWKLPHSKEVNAAIRSYPFDFEVWDTFNVAKLMDEGVAIERYRKKLIEHHVKHACEIKLGGYKVLAVQCSSPDLYSEIAGELTTDRPFGVVFCNDLKRKIRIYSLRSREGGIDVADLAKRFGGGGHRNAAGFTFPL